MAFLLISKFDYHALNYFKVQARRPRKYASAIPLMRGFRVSPHDRRQPWAGYLSIRIT